VFKRAARMANHRESGRETDGQISAVGFQTSFYKKDYSSGENYCTERRKIIIIHGNKNKNGVRYHG